MVLSWNDHSLKDAGRGLCMMKIQGRRDVLQCTSTMCGSGSVQLWDCNLPAAELNLWLRFGRRRCMDLVHLHLFNVLQE